MEKQVHINIFDFDETLFRVPGYTCSQAKDMSPYEWFDSPESLGRQFNICGISNTIDKVKSTDCCLNYLVTHRVKECQAAVMDLLSVNQIKFDDVFFLGRETAKSDTVIELVRQTSATSITVYEDSLWEIIKYAKVFSDLDVTMNFVFVDKSKVITIDWDTACSLADYSQSERLKLI
jgi:hypothetical protein